MEEVGKIKENLRDMKRIAKNIEYNKRQMK